MLSSTKISPSEPEYLLPSLLSPLSNMTQKLAHMSKLTCRSNSWQWWNMLKALKILNHLMPRSVKLLKTSIVKYMKTFSWCGTLTFATPSTITFKWNANRFSRNWMRSQMQPSKKSTLFLKFSRKLLSLIHYVSMKSWSNVPSREFTTKTLAFTSQVISMTLWEASA